MTRVGLRLTSYAFWNRRDFGLPLTDRVSADPELRPAALWLLSHYAVEDDDAGVRFELVCTP